MTDTVWAYLNNEFVPVEAARISPFDRGFLFGHAAYEVTAIYGGQLIDAPGHLARLERTLQALEIANPHSDADWLDLHNGLIDRNQLDEGLIYLQVTGGAYGERDFSGPQALSPSVFMFSTARSLISDKARDGITVITLTDTRWVRRDLKTTQLLSQALAYRAARAAGAETAILHEDGKVTEAASANVWMVGADGVLQTRDLSSAILPGITRASVIGQAADLGLEVREAAFSLEALRGAREVFTTSAGALIAPVISIDGEPVGDGVPGPVTRQVQRAYYTAMGADLSAYGDWL